MLFYHINHLFVKQFCDNKNPVFGLAHTGKWSGLRGSNSLPPPWQGGALPDELHSQIAWKELSQDFLAGASGRNRTNDTRIFSPLLYQLSYRGISRARLPFSAARETAFPGDSDGARTHDL